MLHDSEGRQMDYMRNNLRERYKTDVNVQRLTTGFKSGRDVTSYWINVSGDFYGFIDTWEELQEVYRKLMKGECL